MRLVIILSLICSFAVAQKHYQKNYFENGNLKSAGWIENGKKVKYWRTYYKNGTLKTEGHFKNNLPTKYWKHYSSDGTIESEGHFKNGKKIKEWTDLKSFKKENKLSDLY